MDGLLTWTDCDEAGDYVVPNVLSPRDLVFRHDNIDETVPHVCSLSVCSLSVCSLSFKFVFSSSFQILNCSLLLHNQRISFYYHTQLG